MTKDEALQLALEALEGFIPYLPLKDETQCNRYDKAIIALRLVIDAQNMASKSTYKEQLETKDEPVAWSRASFIEDDDGRSIGTDDPELAWGKEPPDEFGWWPLYTTPQRTWVMLKEEEIDQGLLRSPYALQNASAWREGVAWAIQQLKDKNNV